MKLGYLLCIVLLFSNFTNGLKNVNDFNPEITSAEIDNNGKPNAPLFDNQFNRVCFMIDNSTVDIYNLKTLEFLKKLDLGFKSTEWKTYSKIVKGKLFVINHAYPKKEDDYYMLSICDLTDDFSIKQINLGKESGQWQVEYTKEAYSLIKLSTKMESNTLVFVKERYLIEGNKIVLNNTTELNYPQVEDSKEKIASEMNISGAFISVARNKKVKKRRKKETVVLDSLTIKYRLSANDEISEIKTLGFKGSKVEQCKNYVEFADGKIALLIYTNDGEDTYTVSGILTIIINTKKGVVETWNHEQFPETMVYKIAAKLDRKKYEEQGDTNVKIALNGYVGNYCKKVGDGYMHLFVSANASTPFAGNVSFSGNYEGEFVILKTSFTGTMKEVFVVPRSTFHSNSSNASRVISNTGLKFTGLSLEVQNYNLDGFSVITKPNDDSSIYIVYNDTYGNYKEDLPDFNKTLDFRKPIVRTAVSCVRVESNGSITKKMILSSGEDNPGLISLDQSNFILTDESTLVCYGITSLVKTKRYLCKITL